MAWSRGNADGRLAKAEALKAAVARVNKTVQFHKRHSPTVHLLHVALLNHRLIVYQWLSFKLLFYNTVGSWVNRWSAEDSWQWALR